MHHHQIDSSSNNSMLPLPCIVCRQTLVTEMEVMLHARFHTENSNGTSNSLQSNNSSSFQCCLCLRIEEKPGGGGSSGPSEMKPFICGTCCQEAAGAATTERTMPYAIPGSLFLHPSSIVHHNGKRQNSSNSNSSSSPEHDQQHLNSSLRHSPPPSSTSRLYQCIKCQLSFSSESEVHSHVLESHLSSSNECNLCLSSSSNSQTGSSSFSSPLKLQAHLIEHTFEGCSSFTCYMCSAVFTAASGLQQHMVGEHGLHSRPYDCTNCHLKFFFRAELDNHNFTHVKEEQQQQRRDDDANEDCDDEEEEGKNNPPPPPREIRNGGGSAISSSKPKKFFYRSDDSEEEEEEPPTTKISSSSPLLGVSINLKKEPKSDYNDDDDDGGQSTCSRHNSSSILAKNMKTPKRSGSKLSVGDAGGVINKSPTSARPVVGSTTVAATTTTTTTRHIEAIN
jgi:hypothetical protein